VAKLPRREMQQPAYFWTKEVGNISFRIRRMPTDANRETIVTCRLPDSMTPVLGYKESKSYIVCSLTPDGKITRWLTAQDAVKEAFNSVWTELADFLLVSKIQEE
jgi:hypothetical protein